GIHASTRAGGSRPDLRPRGWRRRRSQPAPPPWPRPTPRRSRATSPCRSGGGRLPDTSAGASRRHGARSPPSLVAGGLGHAARAARQPHEILEPLHLGAERLAPVGGEAIEPAFLVAHRERLRRRDLEHPAGV